MHTFALPLALSLLAAVLPAQEQADPGKLRKTADAAVASQDWEAAVASYRKLVAADPTDGRAWHMLGYSLHASGDLDGALEVHIKATGFPAVAPVASYNAACVHALRGRKEEALTWLEKAASLGFNGAAHIENDSDMDSLRDSPRFKRALQRIEQNGGAQPALNPFTVSAERMLTRFVLFGGGKSAGGVSIAYGQPAWNPKYDELAESSKFENRRWRFGKDEWTTLDASVPLSIGGTEIQAGVWYLTLERRDGKFVMAVIDPATVHQQTIDPYVAHLTKGGKEVTLEHGRSDEVAGKLTIELQADRGALGRGSLAIAFGPHRLSAPLELRYAKAEKSEGYDKR